MKIKIIVVFLTLLEVCQVLSAQNKLRETEEVVWDLSNIKPKGKFSVDSVSLGKSVYYSLSLRCNPELQILFPDSTYSFAPFELKSRQHFDTKTDESGSLDSVVYELLAFEIDKVQKLSLPVYVVMEKDCTAIFATADSLVLEEVIKAKDLDNITPKPHTSLVDTDDRFNYPYVIASVLGFVFVALLVWGLLGKQIRQNYSLFQFQNRQSKFLKDFNRLTFRVGENQSSENIEKALTLWKQHLEYLDEKPFSTYTSKEISKLIPDKDLVKSLKNIDKAIYGQDISMEVKAAFNTLKKLSITKFEQKQAQLKNA